jgi:hypothetical protein
VGFFGFFFLQATSAIVKLIKRSRKDKKMKERKLAGEGQAIAAEGRKSVSGAKYSKSEKEQEEWQSMFEFNRRDLRTHSRQNVAGVKVADLDDLKRNPLWGTQGMSAVYDPTGKAVGNLLLSFVVALVFGCCFGCTRMRRIGLYLFHLCEFAM